MKRRILAPVICMALLACLMTGCTKQKPQMAERDDVLDVYASFYPIYAIADMICGDVSNVRLNCLVQPQDGCLRAYALSDWDLALLDSADALLIGGRGLESFETLLYTLGENGPAVSGLLYDMELREFETAFEDEESHWTGGNPHIYMHTDGAIRTAERIAGSLGMLNAGNREKYAANLETAKDKLMALQAEIRAENALIEGKNVIVMNEALLYVADEFGLKVEKCIERESGEALYDHSLDACIRELKGCEARVILIEKQAPEAFCRALEDAGYDLIYLDVLSTHRADEGYEGYLEALRQNADAIYAAFAAGEVN